MESYSVCKDIDTSHKTGSDGRVAGVRFVYHEYDYRRNWTTRSLITNSSLKLVWVQINKFQFIEVNLFIELFHKNFTSFHCTESYELNKLTSLPMCGFIVQMVEHRTGIAEVTGSNPVEALIFFSGFFSFKLLKLENLLRWSLFTFIYNRSTNMNYFI